MRHQMAHRKLGRTAGHRAALFRNQLASILENERIVTTLIKAKELRPIIEKMVTLGKNDSVHSRRQAARSLPENDAMVKKLFDEVSPRFAQRPGGYTRIIKLGPRRGDGAEMAILEFVDFELEKVEPKEGKAKKKAAAAAESADTDREEERDEEAEEKDKQPRARKPAAKAKGKGDAEKKSAKGKGGAKKGSNSKPKKKKK